ncbi:MAG: hypothetical protein PVH62_08570 [Anaerolineae bacterium]|jgi:hypothetical protein
MTELRNGGLIRVQVHAGRTLGWVLPVWAALCGAVASGDFVLSAVGGGRLLIVFLLVEAGWGTVWSALATTDWATPIRRWRNWSMDVRLALLPYAQPGSPGYRSARWLAQLRAWWRQIVVPTVGSSVGKVMVGLAMSLILAAAAAPELAMLSLAAFALMQLALVLERGRGQPPLGWDCAFRVGLPWLAGHLAFTPLSLPSVALAMVFSTTVAGAGAVDRRWRRILWTGGQLCAASLLILLHRPLAALFLTLLLSPQWLLAAWSPRTTSSNPPGWIRRSWPWLVAGMLLSAWAL